jgi:DNA-binding helix-hairpin-helix protein with protein kinase domain
MDHETKSHYLKIALVVSGAAFLLVYPLSVVWPSGWVWHGGEGVYYFQMICGIYAVLGVYLIAAARKPAAYRSVISFTIWSSVAHALIMAVQAVGDVHEHGHLVGDVPALLVVAGALWYLSPRGAGAVESA